MALDPVYLLCSTEERDGICSAFGTLLVDLAGCVCNISPERNGDNLAVATSFAPILPTEFAIMMPSSFVQVVIRFRSRLQKAFGECYIDALEAEHRSLRDRYLGIHYSKTCWIR
jgi:hypothetical protein